MLKQFNLKKTFKTAKYSSFLYYSSKTTEMINFQKIFKEYNNKLLKDTNTKDSRKFKNNFTFIII